MYKLLIAGGEDSASFLQGQLTQDVGGLSESPALAAAWCNPTGRVIANIRLLALSDGIGMVLPESMVETVTMGLRRYQLRAKVELFAAKNAWSALAIGDDDGLRLLREIDLLPGNGESRASASGLIATDLGIEPRCVEIFGDDGDLLAAGIQPGRGLSDDHWMCARIRAGLPDIGPASSEKYTPQMLNLDLTGAVSFSKGCYTGQEVVARTEHLGKSKRRLMRFVAKVAGARVGDKLFSNDDAVGETVNVCGMELLAVTRLSAADGVLSLNGEPVEAGILPYALPE